MTKPGFIVGPIAGNKESELPMGHGFPFLTLHVHIGSPLDQKIGQTFGLNAAVFQDDADNYYIANRSHREYLEPENHGRGRFAAWNLGLSQASFSDALIYTGNDLLKVIRVHGKARVRKNSTA